MKRVLWVLCILSSLQTAFAQNLKKADAAQAKVMVEKINQTAAGIHSMECNFTQVKTLRFLNDKMTSQGRMLFQADGGKLRWEYQQPYQYTFVLNGQKVYIKSQKSQQAIDIRQSRLFQGIARVMMNSVTGKSLTADGDFDCTMLTSGSEWVARLTPKRREMQKLFKDVSLYFSSQRQMVSRVEMTEPSGDTTVITLKDVKTNVRTDEKMFTAQ